MNKEMRAFQKNVTWKLVPLPHGKKTVGCRWIYNVKLKADGSVQRYKARLVAKGYTQIYGIDYEETFAPVAKIKTIIVILSLAANLNWPLHQFDVKNAFLHGDLEEEVYMDLPQDVIQLLTRKIKFARLESHYIDDIIVTRNDSEEQLKLQKYLSQEFEMKDLGDLKCFLGIEVARSKIGIFLSQRKYVMDLLTETRMLGCKPIDTPIEMNHKLCEDMDQEPTNKEQYQRLVGRLIYLVHTRPDIAYVVSVVSQFMHSPNVSHRNAVDWILRYLKSTSEKGLMFSKNGDLEVVGYTNADWAGSITDRRSTSSYFTFVGGNLVTWRSKKQNVVSWSSAKAEYRGMAHEVCELLWIKRLLTELGFKPEKPMELHCDKKLAIDIAYNPVQHDRTKHVEVDRHFIKEKIEKKIIRLLFVKSEDQLADILTKAVC
ncbi:HXXXD-type acyl-transferase family protein [Prunus dulcis]|uniref:HXXXD-type acyl-transferase family protein n=1 Tax=Prunus dulcis TaxID=3755 RepID=A0A4Y1REA1_PRUDU|nr:HXXXD-type acyl-transferase family protein [Prunus dulcis]